MITPAARLRSYGAGQRIVGVDIARGLAVLGMFGAHVGVQQSFDWLEPSTWSDVVCSWSKWIASSESRRARGTRWRKYSSADGSMNG